MRLATFAILFSLLAYGQESTKSVVPIRVARKVALVIGNSSYRHIPNVPPAGQDADDVAAEFRRLGFDVVVVLKDLGKERTITEINQFARTQVQGGDLVVLYYSGHGGQVGEENFLLPTDYDPPVDEDLVEARAFKMSRVRDVLEKTGARVRVLVFDACRNSPVTTSKNADAALRPMAGRPEGTLIAYASAHNQVARYEKGERNSYYTSELLAALRRPGDLKSQFEDVQLRVFNRTGQKQTPYLYGFLSGPVYLGGAPVVREPRREVAPETGDVTVNPKDGLRYVYIGPGTFRMGCSEGDSECYEDEKPAREVTITRGFKIGQTEVTVEAYQRFAKATGRSMPSEPMFKDRKLNEGWKSGSMPMVNVDWSDSKNYCEWAGGRLLTEAEWEYAARAGDKSARYGTPDEVGWFGDNSGKERIDALKLWSGDARKAVDRLHENENTFHGVGLKAPNRFGLYDTLGNVWEWTADWYGEKYYATAERRDPKGPPNGENRVVRGGSWCYFTRNLRASDRGRWAPSGRTDSIGFRCAWE